VSQETGMALLVAVIGAGIFLIVLTVGGTLAEIQREFKRFNDREDKSK
jgi:hypothetical protein